MLHVVQICLHMVVLSLPIFLFFFFMTAISVEFDRLLLFNMQWFAYRNLLLKPDR
jgi:hypothetical protein